MTDSKFKREAMSKKLREGLANQTTIGEKTFALLLPTTDNHSGHAVGQV